jgi:hypothetical protein
MAATAHVAASASAAARLVVLAADAADSEATRARQWAVGGVFVLFVRVEGQVNGRAEQNNISWLSFGSNCSLARARKSTLIRAPCRIA